MHNHLFLLFPFLSAIVYTFAAMLFKNVLEKGLNIWFLNFMSNLGTFIFVVPLYFWGQKSVTAIPLLPPAIIGGLFVAGQTFSLLALKYGDVSVATPMLGTKVLMVAFFTVILLHLPVPLLLWCAAILTIFALFLLRGNDSNGEKSFLPTVLFSLLCALCFALSDIYLQKWSPQYGPDNLVFVVFVFVTILSLGFFPLFLKNKLNLSKSILIPMTISVLCIGLQTTLMAIALSRFQKATEINIVFSSRGMWSVALAWFLGNLLGNNERMLGKKIFFKRFIGSLLIIVALVLVLLKN